jgi:hypothetical protein
MGGLRERGLVGSDVNWVVTGSHSSSLQGVPVKVHDIDIQTDNAGAYEIEHCFSEFVVEGATFSTAERIRSHLGVLVIDGTQVEIVGYIQKRREDGTWEDPVDSSPAGRLWWFRARNYLRCLWSTNGRRMRSWAELTRGKN